MSRDRPTPPARSPAAARGGVGERPSRPQVKERPGGPHAPAPTRAGSAPHDAPAPIAAWQAFLAGLLHAACMVAAFPPFDLWGFSLVAVAPLVWLVARDQRAHHAAGPGSSLRTPSSTGPRDDVPPEARPRSPFLLGLFAAIGTVPFHAFEHRWLWEVAGPGYPILAALLAMFPLAFVWTLLRLRRRASRVPILVVGPILWGGLEFFRGAIAFDGYPWFFVGHPLVAWWPAAAPARVVGALGVSILAAGVGSAAGWWLARPDLARLRIVGVWLMLLTAGWVVLARWPSAGRASAAATIRVGVVQTNLPQSNKMDWAPADRIDDLLWFLEMTEEAARPGPDGRRPDLIVWPETMFPGTSLDEQARRAESDAQIAWSVQYPDGRRENVAAGALADALLEHQGRHGIPMLVGAIGVDNVRYTILEDGRARRSEDAIYNSVFALADARIAGRYDKIHLTPFGEVMPYISHWAWLEQQLLGIAAAGMRFDLSAGSSPVVLEIQKPSRPMSASGGPSDQASDLPVETASGTTSPIPSPGPAIEASPSASASSTTSEGPDRFFTITPVCFESTNPEVCRLLLLEARRKGDRRTPVIMVNPTNDGWFGNNDAGRTQHLQLARWRAIELGIPVVRAANTGISCSIDARGRITHIGVRAPDGSVARARADGVLIAELSVPGERTIFSEHGDRLGWWVLFAAAGLGLIAFWPTGGGARRPPAPA